MVTHVSLTDNKFQMFFPVCYIFLNLHLRIFTCFFREKEKGKRKGKREHRCKRSIDCLPPQAPRPGIWAGTAVLCAHAPKQGMCPDRESNPEPFRHGTAFQPLSNTGQGPSLLHFDSAYHVIINSSLLLMASGF